MPWEWDPSYRNKEKRLRQLLVVNMETVERLEMKQAAKEQEDNERKEKQDKQEKDQPQFIKPIGADQPVQFTGPNQSNIEPSVKNPDIKKLAEMMGTDPDSLEVL